MKHAHNFVDLTGQIIDGKTVIAFAGRYQRMTGRKTSGQALWLCRCNGCGSEYVVRFTPSRKKRGCQKCYNLARKQQKEAVFFIEPTHRNTRLFSNRRGDQHA